MVIPVGSTLRVYSGFCTDVGRVREKNEDALYQGVVPLGYLALVADGMGGHEQGDIAARLTLDSVVQTLMASETDPAASLDRAFQTANRALREHGAANHCVLGATCVVALICDGLLYVAHVGDARLYLLRPPSLFSLTRDHSLMQEIADIKGPIAATGFAPTLKHIMSRSVGAEDSISPSIRAPIPLSVGDAILLCSDGLTSVVDERRIKRTLAGATPREAADRLIAMANEEGGEDNVTAVVLRVDAEAAPGQEQHITFDQLTSMNVRSADNNLHPIYDVVINPSSWSIVALRLDLTNIEEYASCEMPIAEIGPLGDKQTTITTPRRTEALLDEFRSFRPK